MEKSSFDRATYYYLLGWFPIYFIVGLVVTILDWNDAFLLSIVIAAVIFLIFVVPLVAHLEKKYQKF